MKMGFIKEFYSGRERNYRICLTVAASLSVAFMSAIFRQQRDIGRHTEVISGEFEGQPTAMLLRPNLQGEDMATIVIGANDFRWEQQPGFAGMSRRPNGESYIWGTDLDSDGKIDCIESKNIFADSPIYNLASEDNLQKAYDLLRRQTSIPTERSYDWQKGYDRTGLYDVDEYHKGRSLYKRLREKLKE